jgi:DNA-binding LacI/PurR family transcriptional regulator
MLMRHEIPHIVIGKPAFGSRLCWIDNNNRLSGEIAAHHLLEIGEKRIAFIGGLDEDNISRDRLEGARAELKAAKVMLRDEWVLKGEPTAREGARMTQALLDMKERPQAIICANNYLAYGCLESLRENAVRVPEDMRMITFDAYPFARITTPEMTTVSIDVFEMGLEAGKLLVRKIKKPNLQVQSFTTLPSLDVRMSTRPGMA